MVENRCGDKLLACLVRRRRRRQIRWGDVDERHSSLLACSIVTRAVTVHGPCVEQQGFLYYLGVIRSPRTCNVYSP